MYVSNEKEFGHLVNSETFDVSRTNPDIYQVIDNKLDWEQRYLHPKYHEIFANKEKQLMVCNNIRASKN